MKKMEMSDFRPERLQAARTLLNVTQTQLADQAEVKQSLISMIESHQRPFTPELAKRFAAELNLPIEFFKARPRNIPADSLMFRKHKTASASLTQQTRAHFQEALRVTEDLIHETGYPTPRLPIVQDEEGELTVERIEAIAALTRQALRLDLVAPIPNVTRALERVGIVVVPLILAGADDAAEQITPGHFGVSFWSGPGAPGLVAYFPGSSADRDRFTLAHELGHAVLHSHRQSSDAEGEANRFAGAFLVPIPRARELLNESTTLRSLAMIKSEFGVSIQALVMRGTQAGLISKDRGQTLFRQISSRGWRTKEPVEIGAETPKLLRRLLIENYGTDFERDPRVEHETALPLMMLRALAPSSTSRRSPTAPVVDLASRRSTAGSRRQGAF